MDRDLGSLLVTGQSLPPAVRTSSANGTGIDFNEAGPAVTVVAEVGTVTGTSPTLDITLEESADNSTFTAISGAALTQITASNGRQVVTFYNRAQRYVRAVATIAGTSPSFPSSVTLMSPDKLI